MQEGEKDQTGAGRALSDSFPRHRAGTGLPSKWRVAELSVGCRLGERPDGDRVGRPLGGHQRQQQRHRRWSRSRPSLSSPEL